MIPCDTILRNIKSATHSPQRNPVVHRCCEAARLAVERSYATHLTNDIAAKDAGVTAYRNAMPSLAGFENIRDYVACVAHGMLIGVIDPNDGPKFLYAAQVALGVLPREPKRLRRKANGVR